MRKERGSGFVAAGILCAGVFSVQAAVEGRYVRLDALTHAMENCEWEVFSGGKNLLRGHPERLSSGTGIICVQEVNR